MRHENVWSIDIDADPATVWSALTHSGEPQPFYFGSVLRTELRPGAELRYTSPDGRHTYIVGQVVEVAPERKLVHTFRFSDLDEEPGTVTFLIEPKGTGCRVVVQHDGPGPKHASRVNRGWARILAGMKTWVETGTVPLRTRASNLVMKALTPMVVPKSGTVRP